MVEFAEPGIDGETSFLGRQRAGIMDSHHVLGKDNPTARVRRHADRHCRIGRWLLRCSNTAANDRGMPLPRLRRYLPRTQAAWARTHAVSSMRSPCTCQASIDGRRSWKAIPGRPLRTHVVMRCIESTGEAGAGASMAGQHGLMQFGFTPVLIIRTERGTTRRKRQPDLSRRPVRSAAIPTVTATSSRLG